MKKKKKKKKLVADLKVCLKCPHYSTGYKAIFDWPCHSEATGYLALCGKKTSHPSILTHKSAVAYSITSTVEGPYIYNENFTVPIECPYRLEFLFK